MSKRSTTTFRAFVTRCAAAGALIVGVAAVAPGQEAPRNPLERPGNPPPGNPLERPGNPPGGNPLERPGNPPGANPLERPANPPTGAGVLLSPRYPVGLRWSMTYHARWDVAEQLTNGQPFPSDAVNGLKGAAAMWVIEAEENQIRRMLIEYDRCTTYAGTRNQAAPPSTPLPHSNAQFLFARAVSPITGKERIRLTPVDAEEADKKRSQELEDAVRMAMTQSLMPAGPVRVGQAFESVKVGVLFGPDFEGKLQMRLAEVRGTDAIVQVTDAVVTRGVGTGATATYRFTGTIVVDTNVGLAKSMNLQGTGTVESKFEQLNMTSIQRGPWMYEHKVELMAPKMPTPEQLKKYKPGED